MIDRQIGDKIKKLSAQYFSVCIFGPRQCGKTTLAKRLYDALGGDALLVSMDCYYKNNHQEHYK